MFLEPQALSCSESEYLWLVMLVMCFGSQNLIGCIGVTKTSMSDALEVAV